MRRLKGYVHINAPVQTVRSLVDGHRRDWMVTRGGVLLRTLSESWEATEANGGTNFMLAMEYAGRLAILEDFMADGVQESIAASLGRLKVLAEGQSLPH
jgi:hypothetical protein